MHDIVRSFAISTAFKDHHVYTAQPPNNFLEWPVHDLLANLTRIDLHSCETTNLPEVLECPTLELFKVRSTDLSLKIHDNFFEKTTKLKVLDLTHINFPQLPPSLKSLENLQTLCLDDCILKDIAMIGKLKKLQVLSFLDSDIIQLPKELGQLSSLRLLDLSGCRRLEIIEPNVLSSLTQLEDLKMENMCLPWSIGGRNTKRTNACLDELKCLSKLSTLHIHITDAKMVPKGLFSENLERFRILIGDGWDWSNKYKTSRTLKIKLDENAQWKKSLKELKGLLKNTEDLYLDQLKGIQSFLFELDVLSFSQLKHFHIENSSDIQYIVNSSKRGHNAAFLRLESLLLDNLPNLKQICNGQLEQESFSKLRILEVGSCEALENLVSSFMARGLLHLEQIKVNDCKSLKEIVSIDDMDGADNVEAIVFPKLLKLVLDSLPQFSRFCSKMKTNSKRDNETEMPLFDEKIRFPNLEELKLSSIIISNIWNNHTTEVSCVLNLRSLTTDGCNNLKYLFSSSLLESLVNLKTLQVTNCRMMQQLIGTEASGERTNKVTFRHLDSLKLQHLPELAQVCTSNLLDCPMLKELCVTNCPRLRCLVSKYDQENKAINQVEPTNFSLFDEKVALPNLEALEISNMDRVTTIWHNELRDDSFSKLKRVFISNAEELIKIFPSYYVLSQLKNLETLSVADCDSLEEIFDFEAIAESTLLRVATQLKTLELENLPNLMRICNKGAMKVLSFSNLHNVKVFQCPKLRSVFPASLARDLSQLTNVDIRRCGIEEIVSKEEGEGLTADFHFPELTRLTLWSLPELKRFYSGTHTAEYPKLKYVDIYDCEKVEIFTLESEDLEEQCSDDQLKSSLRQPLFSAEKIIPKLEELTLNSNDARMLLEGPFSTDELCNVKVLHLQSFVESTPFPFGLIQRFNNLETLDIGDSYFNEIFAHDSFTDLENQETNFEKIRLLRLELLYCLKRIRLDHVLKNLEMLQVITCGSLTILSPASASFQNLVVLDVQQCNGLVNLITSSTAKSLVQLKEMSVMNCEVLKEILANEEDEGEIVINFHKLESLRLFCLTNLTQFSSAVFSLRFPSLEKVSMEQCPKMTDFSLGDLHTPKLRRVQTEGREKIRWMGDLNSTVQNLYSELAGFNDLKQLELSKFPKLKERWPGQLPVRFDKLKTLVVDDSSIAISWKILPELVVLEELTVRNCNSVEEAFDFGQPDTQFDAQHLSRLKVFQLVDLPNLKHVWNENAKRMLDLRKLTKIKIEKCGSLRCIFTPSLLTSLNQLQEIVVKSCHAVVEIVAKEVEHDTIIFPKLNSITFEDLPNVTCFCSGNGACEFPSLTMISLIDCPNTLTCSFLGEQEHSTSIEATEAKMIIPNLKEMKLSSILMERIWDEKMVEKSYSFQSLTSLTVDGCHNLKYTLSSFIVESLVNLKTLQVINCRTMEEILLGEEIGHVTFSQLEVLRLKNLPTLAHVCSCDLFECPALKELEIVNCPKLSAFISTSVEEVVAVSNDAHLTNLSLFDEKVAFPNLEKLEITDMKCVKMIWHEILQENSFSKLEQLSISNAEELVGIFPSTYILSKFTNLEALSIARCNLLEKIIGFEAIPGTTHKMVATKPKIPDLKRLSNMRYIWNNDAVEILSFSNIQNVDISDCPNLKSLFPVSVAKVLLKVTSISITDCGTEEIVSAEVGQELVSSFRFPRLTHLELWRLPELKRFYPGLHTVEFPKLKILRVYKCEKFAVLTTESQYLQEKGLENQNECSQEQSLLFAEKVIPWLEELTLNQNDARMLWEGQFLADLQCSVRFLRLQCFRDESATFPLGLIQRFNSLDTLHLVNCCFREIFLHDEKNHSKDLEKIRSLRLDVLYNLKQIKGDYVLKSLKDLEVYYCQSLTNLALPSAFQNLKCLHVKNCGGLVSLITSSTAETLVQLTELRVENCGKLREIMINEGKACITFHRLESLRFDCLASLTNFCSATCTLRFPVLDKVILKECPKMTIFSEGNLHAPLLGMVETEGKVYESHWNDDLNATVKQMHAELAGFDGISQMKLSEFPELKIKWPDDLPVKLFEQLSSLVVDDCPICSVAVSSKLLPFLDDLEELEVRHCDSVEEVFDVGQPSEQFPVYLSLLTKFHLVDLAKLKHLCTKNVKGMLDFAKLQQIKIQNCGSLRYVFTPSLLMGLRNLQEIEVRSCPAIEEIVAKDEAIEEIVAKDDAMIFPLLNSITLEDLPKLSSFYSASVIVKFPCLKTVAVVDCPKIFTSSFLKGQEPSTSDEATEAKVAFPSLEKLKVIWDDVIYELIQDDIFCKLKVFELIRFPDDDAAFSSHIFRKLPCLENLVLSDAAFEEISWHTETNDKECHFGIPPLLKDLNVSKFPKLSDFSTGSRSQLLLKDLQSLRVSECINLKLLLPVSVSFECLTVLEVSKCHGLKNLILKAKPLVQLTKLSVTECQMMTEIVAEDERMPENIIIFGKLKRLNLKSLPELTGFFTGKDSLMFPTLEWVHVSECPKLKAFSQGEVSIPKLKKLQLPVGEDEGYGEDGHYVHLQKLFSKMKKTVVKPRHNAEIQKTHEDKAEDIVFSMEIATEDQRISKNPNSSKDLIIECETSNKVASEKVTITASLGEAKIIDETLDFPSISTNKNDSVECEDIRCNLKENNTHISSRNLNDDIHEKKEEVSSDSSIPPNEDSKISHSRATTSTCSVDPLESLFVGTDEVPTPTLSSKLATSSFIDEVSCDSSIPPNEDSNISNSRATTSTRSADHVPTPTSSLKFATSSFTDQVSHDSSISPNEASNISHSHATTSTRSVDPSESLFVGKEEVSVPTTSLKFATRSFTVHDTPESIMINLEHTYLDHIFLLKKILTKPLAEVSRSHDAHVLLSTLENLKSCPHLNSQQSGIIRNYIEQFDTLVTYHSFYEDEIGRASALKLSLHDDMKRLPELKTLHDNLANKAVSLSAVKERLKKELQEVEEEEEIVRSDMESLRSKLVTKNMKEDALPKASMRQKEFEDKATRGNDHWTKMKNLFA